MISANLFFTRDSCSAKAWTQFGEDLFVTDRRTSRSSPCLAWGCGLGHKSPTTRQGNSRGSRQVNLRSRSSTIGGFGLSKRKTSITSHVWTAHSQARSATDAPTPQWQPTGLCFHFRRRGSHSNCWSAPAGWSRWGSYWRWPGRKRRGKFYCHGEITRLNR